MCSGNDECVGVKAPDVGEAALGVSEAGELPAMHDPRQGGGGRRADDAGGKPLVPQVRDLGAGGAFVAEGAALDGEGGEAPVELAGGLRGGRCSGILGDDRAEDVLAVAEAAGALKGGGVLQEDAVLRRSLRKGVESFLVALGGGSVGAGVEVEVGELNANSCGQRLGRSFQEGGVKIDAGVILPTLLQRDLRPKIVSGGTVVRIACAGESGFDLTRGGSGILTAQGGGRSAECAVSGSSATDQRDDGERQREGDRNARQRASGIVDGEAKDAALQGSRAGCSRMTCCSQVQNVTSDAGQPTP